MLRGRLSRVALVCTAAGYDKYLHNRSFSSTAECLRSFKPAKKDASKPWTHFDDTSSEAHTEDRTFEDTTAISTETEEMPAPEVESRIKVYVSQYDQYLFAYTFFQSVDIVDMMLKEDLIPRVRPELAVCRWLGDAKQFLRNPNTITEKLGPERWERLKKIIDATMTDYNAVSPIHRVLRKYKLSAEMWVPLLRQMGIHIHATVQQQEVTPSMVLSLCNGRGPHVLGLPSEQASRVKVVSELLIAAGTETGCSVLAFLGLHAMRGNGLEIPYVLQKSVSSCLSAAAKREIDWSVRECGDLEKLTGTWLKKYFRQVEEDNEGSTRNLTDFISDESVAEEVPQLAAVDEEDEEARFQREVLEDSNATPEWSPQTQASEVSSYFTGENQSDSDWKDTKKTLSKLIDNSVEKRAAAVDDKAVSKLSTKLSGKGVKRMSVAQALKAVNR